MAQAFRRLASTFRNQSCSRPYDFGPASNPVGNDTMEMLSRRAVVMLRWPFVSHNASRFSTLSPHRQKYESSVQTPLQSQNKDSVAPSTAARPEAEAAVLETPLQKQRREALAPSNGPAQRKKSWVLPSLMAGLVSIPPIVYFYYQHRREHMDNKRAMLVEQQRQKYASGG